MFKTILSICFIFTILFGVNSYAQDEMTMTPPPAVNNKVYESMIGDWYAESSMMGVQMTENLKIYWDLNHQFIVLDLRTTGKEDPNVTYQGRGFFGVDEQGNANTWWFDTWGATGVATGSGAFGDNKVTINNGNLMLKETRSFLVSGNEMVMSAKGTMTMGGKETPFDQTTIYKK